jgi:hypothetical protein
VGSSGMEIWRKISFLHCKLNFPLAREKYYLSSLALSFFIYERRMIVHTSQNHPENSMRWHKPRARWVRWNKQEYQCLLDRFRHHHFF